MAVGTVDSLEDQPFNKFLISDNWYKLLGKDERDFCPKCSKSRKYFCYTCYVPMNELKDITPRVKLPLPVDIIKHPKEIDGKSTAVHAAIICPEDVNVYVYPSIPNYNKLSNVILIFPSKDAIGLEEAAKKLSLLAKEESSDQLFSRVVFIDSTWNQCRTILNDSRIKTEIKSMANKIGCVHGNDAIDTINQASASSMADISKI